MKKIFLFYLIIFSFSAFKGSAQYRSLFGDSSTEWTFFEQCLADAMPIPSLVSQGDTVINGLTYKVMYRPYQQHYCVPYTVDYFYLREDTVSGKAWGMDTSLSENLVYDMSLDVGDTMFSVSRQFIVDSVYFLDGRKHLLARRHSTAYGMLGR